jgi:hypothetical protein
MTKTNSQGDNSTIESSNTIEKLNSQATILSKTVIYNRTGTQYWTLEAETQLDHSNLVNCCEYHQKMHQNAQPTADNLGLPKLVQTQQKLTSSQGG